MELGAIEVSREWLDALLKTLVKKSVIPEREEIKNLLHQTAVKSLLLAFRNVQPLFYINPSAQA